MVYCYQLSSLLQTANPTATEGDENQLIALRARVTALLARLDVAGDSKNG